MSPIPSGDPTYDAREAVRRWPELMRVRYAGLWSVGMNQDGAAEVEYLTRTYPEESGAAILQHFGSVMHPNGAYQYADAE